MPRCAAICCCCKSPAARPPWPLPSWPTRSKPHCSCPQPDTFGLGSWRHSAPPAWPRLTAIEALAPRSALAPARRAQYPMGRPGAAPAARGAFWPCGRPVGRNPGLTKNKYPASPAHTKFTPLPAHWAMATSRRCSLQRLSTQRQETMTATRFVGQLNQEKIVFGLTLLLFIGFASTLPNFLAAANILSLLRSVAVLGMLGLGMLIVVLGRGVDLSLVATMAISVAWSVQLVHHGVPVGLALAIGLALALVVGLVNGLLVAYAEIPPLFATLAMGTLVYGFGRAHLITGTDVVYVPQGMGWVLALGQGALLGVPMPIVMAALCALVCYLLLRYTKAGQFVFAEGANLKAARIGAIAVRPILTLQYGLSGAIAFFAGVITATSVQAMNTRIVNSNLIYDVLLVVILGGVGLSGGKGSVRNVIVGTLLIGVLLNGMTIMDIQYTVQNVIKSMILLIAIVADSIVNPRDEQTGQQGDI